MEKLFSKVEEPLMKFGDKINNILFFEVLRDAFMLVFPLIIFGSVVTIIGNFPFLADIFGSDAAAQWRSLLTPASNATMNIMSLFVCVGIGYYYAKSKKVEPLICSAICVTSFLLMSLWLNGDLVETDANGQATGNVLVKSTTVMTTRYLGAQGMFVAIFLSFFMSFCFCFFSKKNLQIKMPEQVPPAVSKSFASLLPAVFTLSIALIIRTIFVFSPWEDIFDFIGTFVQTPLVALGSGFGATVIAIFFVQFFWFFGLHGQIIVNSMMDPIWNTLMMQNYAQFTNGSEVSNIITKPFMEVFTVGLGGSGATLIVIIMILLFVRSKQIRSLGKLALPAGIFNVNEPFIFGLPIIFNPLVLIPWILAPMVSVSIAYFAMWSGLVPLTTGVAVPWTTPVLLSGMLATNSWQGAVLQLVQMLAVGIIWFPFLKILDRKLFKEENTELADNKKSSKTKKGKEES